MTTYIPDLTVEISFDGGVNIDPASWTWTDVTDYVEVQYGIEISSGRQDERSQASPLQLRFTVDNRDGRFTPENAAGAYYPDVQIGRPVRVSCLLPDGVTTSTRAVAFVDEWPVEWPDGTDVVALAQITASGRLARLGQSGELRSIVEEQILLFDPIAYYPLGEGSDATTATDASTHGQPKLRRYNIGGTDPTFGSATGPATDSLTGVTIANNGNPLRATLEGLTPGSDYAILCWFSTTDVSTAQVLGFGDLWVNLNNWTANQLDLRTPASVAAGDPSGTTDNDGSTLLLYLTWDDSTSTATLNIGFVVAADQVDATAVPGPELIIGNNRMNGEPDEVYSVNGSFFHVAVWDRILDGFTEYLNVLLAGSTGFSGDEAAARFARWMEFAGMPAAALTSDTGQVTLSHIDTTGKNLEQLFRIVEETEGGVLFDGRDGTLTFHDNAHRHNATDAFTLSVAAQELAAGMRPVLDRSQVVNDVTAKNLTNTFSARFFDQTSIDELGPTRETVELATDDEDLPYQAAASRVNRYANPRVRIPELAPVDVLPLDASLTQAIVETSVGDRFTVTGLPSQAPASSLSFFVEGWRERIGVASWTVEFNVSAAALSDVWVLDSADYSQLGSTTTVAY